MLGWRWAQQAGGLSAGEAESLVLAKSFVEGEGLRLTPFSSAQPGPPSVAWFLVEAAVIGLGGEPVTWLPRLALGCLLAMLVLVSLRGALVWRRGVRADDALPALALAAATALAEAGALGSGACAWALALTCAAVVVGRGLSSGAVAPAGVVMGALCLFRPSAVWLVAASAVAWWLAARVEGRRATREAAGFLLAGFFVAAVVFGARLLLLGELPLEGVWPAAVGTEATVSFVNRQARWIFAAFTGLLVACVWRRFHLRGGATLLAWVAMTVVLSMWTSNARGLFLGALPLLAMVVGEGLSAAREATLDAGLETSLRGVGWAGLLACVVMTALAAVYSYLLEPVMPRTEAAAPRPELTVALRERSPGQPLVVWTDGVEAAALFPFARVVVAKTPSAALEDLLLSEGPPDVVDARLEVPRLDAVLTESENGVRWLAGASADDDVRCPGGRLALVSLSADELFQELRADANASAFSRGLSRWRCALAALKAEQLPPAPSRRVLGDEVAALSQALEAKGEFEASLRAASLAASLTSEEVHLRARAERLRRRFLAAP